MSQSYTPTHIANYFISKSQDEAIDVSPMKLLKLVYIGYGWMLALFDRKLFDEEIEAWYHGPVIPSLYHEFKHYGRNPIDEKSSEFNLDGDQFTYPEISTDDEDAQLVLSKVWGVYKVFDAWALRQKTHEKDTPWDKTYNKNTDQDNKVIPDKLIKEHFKEKITRYLDAAR